MKKKPLIFISHSSKNKDQVAKLRIYFVQSI